MTMPNSCLNQSGISFHVIVNLAAIRRYFSPG
jgi:hypothetical protein